MGVLSADLDEIMKVHANIFDHNCLPLVDSYIMCYLWLLVNTNSSHFSFSPHVGFVTFLRLQGEVVNIPVFC